ncbi:neuronal acetylcholine receptor subunit alpha-3-like isoform X2 [Ruditapes philippinarum]|uniref:neuronal acetylcholine receptor subunit alpha-3-like isoform X2 n=1 Tax=Ruditapes philippinarum TaxID=129788 RepID=UPI00295BA9F4|nr:neuronal acetylcholine receptor subunit alpha-3-like isoform X2 [Ruditapes philippinarum]
MMKMYRNKYVQLYVYLLIEIFAMIGVVETAYSAAKETEIRSETVLAASYDPVSRPKDQTHVKAGLNVLAIDELDLKGQKLTMAGWLTFEWEDDRTVWDKAAKDDIEYIFTQPKYIWKPELVVDNALQDLDILANDNLLLRLKYDGTVDWEPPLLFVTHCEVDITYYPYDQQKCAIEIVSWTYTIEEVKLEHLFETVNLEDFETHGEWEITRTEIEDKNLTEHLPGGTVRVFPQIDFWIYLRRRTQFYNLNVMMPIILTSLMVALVFIVPVDSGEKLSYVLTVFLALAVLLTIVADSLPPTSITLSVLGLYLGIVLILAAVGILITILILIMFHREGQPDENSFIITLTRNAAKIICWNSSALNTRSDDKVSPMRTSVKTAEVCTVVSSDTNNDVMFDVTDKKRSAQNNDNSVDGTDETNEITWKIIAQILDRFCFFFFLIITVIMNFSFVVTLATGGRTNGH